MGVDVIIPAAGTGRRFGGQTPKQYLLLQGKPIIAHVIDFFSEQSLVERITVAVHPEDHLWRRLGVFEDPKVRVVHGGEARFQSVLLSLESLSELCRSQDWVLVHDAVRPCLSESEFTDLIETCRDSEVGGLLGTPVVDTLKIVQADIVQSTLPREQVWKAQTPQMFRYGRLKEALNAVIDQDTQVTDEASAIEGLGYHPIMVKGKSTNLKITRPEDLELASLYLGNNE